MPSLPCSSASMRLVHDDELRASAEELVAPFVAFDVVEADDGMRVSREDAYPCWEFTLEAICAGGGHRHGTQMKASFELTHPLIYEMRRAEHSKPVDLSSVMQFAGDERSLNCLANPDVV